jgi:valyl-tRNA synthetase
LSGQSAPGIPGELRWYREGISFRPQVDERIFILSLLILLEAKMTAIDLPKAYDFKSTEGRIYRMWEEKGYFQPVNDPRKPGFNPALKPYVISIPPPNITGELHLGSALFVSLEDLMIRYHRMKGVPALWVPGSDHAGIATQLQVEKALHREGLNREKIGREEFLRRTWAWKEKFGGIITGQIRRLGASCDWTRQRFTLDAGLSLAVREAFVRLYEKGLIYRGPRLINWSPGLKTAVSDLEVVYSEEPGTLYYFKYMLAGSKDEFIPVATTRPETILGDTAVAVHPDDERYRKYIGRKVVVPMLGREIPVIADEYVDREFGTGALKITPGHDPNDYQIGQKHGLEMISILDTSAHINKNGGKYAGQDRFDCRKNLWEDMHAAGLVIKEQDYLLNIPRSQRGGEIIEPMISTQWFVRMESLAEPALEAVRSGRIKIVPEHFNKVYYNWLENIQDWCISRQLWWGHRIPVWYCEECQQLTVTRTDPTTCSNCGSSHIDQDPDVLDTWFSSALWPFSTLGWPVETPDYRYFYPTTMMETAYDILFFWVARMIMFGLEFTGDIPFNQIYLHGLVRDERGRKMSKSNDNVVDPLLVMEKMGTDALRFTLLVGSTPGKDSNLSASQVEPNRNFVNKIWNASRFIFTNLQKIEAPASTEPDWTLADSWIWARVQELVRSVERLFQTYQYGEAGRQIYDFFWSEFADWYIEVAKLQLGEGGDRAYYTASTLVRVLDLSLRMLHPFTPFVTEEIWGNLKSVLSASPLSAITADWADDLIVASWPVPRDPEGWEEAVITDFNLVRETIRAIRNIRAEKGVKAGRKIPALLAAGEKTSLFTQQKNVISSLAQLDLSSFEISASLPPIKEDQIGLAIGPVEIYLPLEGMVNKDQERERITGALSEAENQASRLENLLSSSFTERAPAEIVQKEKDKLSDFKETIDLLKKQLEALS